MHPPEVSPRLRAIAERQWRDYRAGTPGTAFAASFALALQEAYAVQALVSGLRVAAGDAVCGYKVGCTGPGTVAQFGMAGPVRGTLFRSEVRTDGAILDPSRFCRLAVEGEMAVRIGEDGRAAVAFPVVELHNFVFRAPRPTLAELVANNAFNAGLVLPADAWPTGSPNAVPDGSLEIRIGDRLAAAGDPWPLGTADASVDWLRADLERHGLALRPGDLVLAGTTMALYEVSPGEHVTVSIGGSVAVRCMVGGGGSG